MRCGICQKLESEDLTLRHLPIYIVGSEGIEVCHDCEMSIVDFIRGMKSCATRSRMEGMRAMKELKEREIKRLTKIP